MLFNNAFAKKLAEKRTSVDAVLVPLYAEADYLFATISSDEKDGLTVDANDDRHVRIDSIMDEITRLINLI